MLYSHCMGFVWICVPFLEFFLYIADIGDMSSFWWGPGESKIRSQTVFTFYLPAISIHFQTFPGIKGTMCLPGGKCILQLILQRGFQCRRLLGSWQIVPFISSFCFLICSEVLGCMSNLRRFVQGTCTFEDRIQYRFWRKWRLGMSWLWIDLLTIKAVCKGTWQEYSLETSWAGEPKKCWNQNRPALHHCTASSYCDGKATWCGWHVKLLLMRSFQNAFVPIPPDPPKCMLECLNRIVKPWAWLRVLVDEFQWLDMQLLLS